jgi:hypothetical protein
MISLHKTKDPSESSLKVLIPCILIYTHLQNQINAVTNIFKGLAVQYYYMFRHLCTLLREFIHQI